MIGQNWYYSKSVFAFFLHHYYELAKWSGLELILNHMGLAPSCNDPIVFKVFLSRPKTTACPAWLQEQIVLASLKAACPQDPYWVHFSPSRSKIQYRCSLPLSKQAIDGDVIPKEKLSMKHVINLEVKNITKSSLAYERVFLDYLLGESEQIYWILNLEGEVHSIWVLWTSGLQECTCNFILFLLKLGRASNGFRLG